jgi:glycosyltransferase involved in cell wall biosynthesis
VASRADSGLTWYSAQLASALTEFVPVRVLGPCNGEPTWWDGDVEVSCCYTRGSLATPWRVAAAAIASEVGVVHFQHELFAYGGAPVALLMPAALAAIRRAGRRVVTTVHGVVPLRAVNGSFARRNGSRLPPRVASAAWRAHIRSVCGASSAVVVHEGTHRDILESDYGVARNVSVIPLGVKIEPPINVAERRQARVSLGIDPEAEVLSFFGYLAGYKGIEEFCEAIPRLLAKRPTLHVVVAGAVPRRLLCSSKLDERLASLARLCGRVRAMGFVPEGDIRRTFAATDLFILPYTARIAASGPLSLAMGYGVPTLVSRVIDPDAGRFVAFDPTPDGITDAVCSYFQDGAAREAARSYVSALRGEREWNEIARRVAGVYGSL